MRRVEIERNPWGKIHAKHLLAEGALPTVTADSNGVVTEFREDDLYQNLVGENGIIGRGMSLSLKDSDSILACCAIGVDIYRAPVEVDD